MGLKRSTILTVLLAMILAGCAPQRSNKGSIGRTTRSGGIALDKNQIPSQNQTAESYGKKWAAVLKFTNWSQSDFQARVKDLVSNLQNPDGSRLLPCYTSGESNQSTGVRLWGSVGVTSGQINGSTAALRISVYDACVGKTDQNGQVITEIPIYIAPGVEGYSASGYISNNQVDIQFADSYGIIRVIGQVSGSQFSGKIYYDNFQYWDGQTPGAAGYLGGFTIPSCSFFICNGSQYMY